ncbi:MAG: HipA domain-containing protein [Methylobacter sp.]|nr:HipA domain-containing protein [Methylobacter sp.]
MKLSVKANQQLVGWLSFDNQSGLFAFGYSPGWLAQDVRFPLSPSLPLDHPTPSAEKHSEAVRRFFQNLLPEGQALDDAAQAIKVSKANLMGLLVALGQETAGALVISLPDGHTSQSGYQPNKRLLIREELSARIRSRPDEAFTVWDGKVRLSIAGHQDKIAVLEENNQWYLVDGEGLASTHIIKPEPLSKRLQHMTSNELACMLLAKSVGLPVAEVRLERIPEPIVLIRRFDRAVRSNRVHRLHCIDGCQALGLGVAMKYERPYGDGRDVQHIRDGVSLPKLFALLDQNSAKPAVDRLVLLRWAIFQVLIGNTDAHGKNLSFFIAPGGLGIAPAYDLVCCLIYTGERISDTLAMAIGDNFEATALTAYDWAQLASECRLNPKLISRELNHLANTIVKTWPVLLPQLLQVGTEKHTLAAMETIFMQQCQRAQSIAPDIPKIPKDIV